MKCDENINIAKECLESKKLDGYEIFYLENDHFLANAKDGSVETLESAKEVGLACRVISDQRLGFSYTNLMNKDKIEKCVQKAVVGSKAVHRDEALSLVPPKEIQTFDWKYNDNQLAEISANEKANLAISLESRTLGADQRIKRVRHSRYEEIRSKIMLVNSEGVDLNFAKSIVSCEVLAVAEEDGDSQWSWDFDFSHSFDELDIEGVAERAAANAISLLGAKHIPTVKTSVCLHPIVSSQFLQALCKSFYGDNIYKKKSTLIGKIGVQLFSECLNIYDDGLLKNGFGSMPFDGEGEPCRKISLVESGVIKNWLTDRYWGEKLGMTSTGSATRASVKELPVIGSNNIYIEPSESTKEELFKKMNKGFYITNIIGAHTINTITGDFSVGAEGQWIEDGVIHFPVKGVVIAGNINEIFSRVESVGSDLKFIGGTGSPTIMISGIQVSGQ